jgi:sulfoxide reductase heme-binding subunit YedZ
MPPHRSPVQRLVDSRPLLWAILAIPAAWLLVGWTSGALTYGETVTETGRWAAWLLMLTLAVTPLRLTFRKGAWLVWLVRRRRNFGVATFAYAALHTLIYAARKADLGLMIEEAQEPWLWAGWLALAVFLALALTSNDAAVKVLRRWWKRLHRLVYVAAVLMFVHWALSAFDPTLAYAHIALLAALEAIRVALQLRQRVT